MSVATGALSPPEPKHLRFHHTGKLFHVLPLALLNFLLMIVTIGMYRFWARTRIRKYLWSRTTFMGDALEYAGRGNELYIGFLLSVLVFIVPVIAANAAIELSFGEHSQVLYAFTIAVSFFVFWLTGYAFYSAQRYRMSRTYWRGIRAGLAGTRSEYARKFVRYWLLTIITLGLLTPVRDVALYRHVMNNASFGDKKFSYTGTSGPVYGAYFLSLVLLIIGGILYAFLAAGLLVPFVEVSIGMDQNGSESGLQAFILAYFYVLLFSAGLVLVMALAFSVYQARLVNHFVSKLKLDGAPFSLRPRATAWSLAWLILGNFLISVLTLGIGLPMAQMRTLHYIVSRLQIDDNLDTDGIRQSELEVPRYGEGLVELLNGGTI